MWLHCSSFVCCFGSLMRGRWLCLSKTFDLFAWRPWGFFHRWGLMLLLGRVFYLVLQGPSSGSHFPAPRSCVCSFADSSYINAVSSLPVFHFHYLLSDSSLSLCHLGYFLVFLQVFSLSLHWIIPCVSCNLEFNSEMIFFSFCFSLEFTVLCFLFMFVLNIKQLFISQNACLSTSNFIFKYHLTLFFCFLDFFYWGRGSSVELFWMVFKFLKFFCGNFLFFFFWLFSIVL